MEFTPTKLPHASMNLFVRETVSAFKMVSPIVAQFITTDLIPAEVFTTVAISMEVLMNTRTVLGLSSLNG